MFSLIICGFISLGFVLVIMSAFAAFCIICLPSNHPLSRKLRKFARN